MQIRTDTYNENKVFKRMLFILFLSLNFSNLYVDVGFSLKLYMIITCFLLVVLFQKIYVNRLFLFEITLLLFYSYYIFTVVFSKYPQEGIRLAGAILIVIIFYFLIKYLLINISIKNIEEMISTVGLISSVSSLVYYFLGLMAINFNFMGNNIISYGVLIDRNAPRLIGTFSDPNIFAFANSLFLFFYLFRLNSRKNALGLFFIVLTLILTLSRGAIIAVFIGLIISFLLSSKKSKIKTIFITPIIFIVFNKLIFQIFNIDIFSTLLLRFNEVSTDAGSGRFTIWGNGLTLFSENPIFGIGIYNFRSYSVTYFGIDHYMHNTFLEVIVESGLIGTTLYLIFLITIILSLFKIIKISSKINYLFVTFLTMIFMMLSLSLIANESFFLLLALIARYFMEFRKDRSYL